MHNNVFYPRPTRTFGGASYIVTFTGDATKKVLVHAMKSKENIFFKFLKLLLSIKGQSQKKLKDLALDNGCKYVSFVRITIKWESFTLYNPTQNGFARRKTGTIHKRILLMILDADLMQGFWLNVI